MKNTIKPFGLALIAAISFVALSLAGCQTPDGGSNQTPTVTDFNISGTGTFTYDGNPKIVTVTAKEGKTSGAITVNYNGNVGDPSAVGTYTVTFDVAAATGWNAASGLAAGTLTISDGSVSVTPITSVSIIIIAPTKDEVPATTATASGAVNYTIGTVTWSPNDNPFQGGKVYTASVTLSAADGHTFTGLTTAAINGQTATVSNNTGGSVTLSHTFPVTDTRSVNSMSITAQPTKLTYSHEDTLDLAGLTVTLNYNDNSSDLIAAADFAERNITTSPADGDTLSVVAHNGQPVTISYGSHTSNTNALTVAPIAPVLADFTVSGTGVFTYDGNPKTVTVTAKEDKTIGTITVKYNGSETAPSNAGTYPVTIDVTADTNYTVVNGLSVGTLAINKATPTASDFEFGNLTQTFGSVTTVTITPKSGKSDGAQTIYYTGTGATTYAKSATLPTAVGTYAVTFNVAASTNFNEATDLNAGTLTIRLVEMVQVEGGSFQMGKDLGTAATGDETPVHTVTLSSFSIGKYLVTQEQYQAVMGSNPSYFHGGSGREPADGEVQGKRPVEMVSWYDTIVFCNKLSVKEGLSPVYSISGSTDPSTWDNVPTGNDATWNAVIIVAGSNGYRLPTEAQWEYAAKGGNPNATDWTGYTYSGSDMVDDVAWYDENSDNISHEVGKKTANHLGLYDMSGNVWEWCWDWLGNYSSEAQNDPAGVVSGSQRVLRGGTCYGPDDDVRSTNRGYYVPYGKYYNFSKGDISFGFRLVRQ
jgi:formylglycine-generating enzyme required for sulfatase activity